MTEYQARKYKERARRSDKQRRERTQATRDRENMICTAMVLLYEYGDFGAAKRYVEWKVRQMRKEQES